MKRKLFIFLNMVILLAGFSLPCPVVAGKGDAGSNAGQFLELDRGSVPAALGGAVSGFTHYPGQTLFYNPSHLAFLRKKEAGFTHQNLVLDINYESLYFAAPFYQRQGNWAIGLDYVDLGDIRRTTIQSFSQGVSLGTASGNDLMLYGSYAWKLEPRFALGGTLKLIREKLDDRSATSVAIDAGMTFLSPWKGITLGMGLRNVGTSLEFFNDREELPLTFQGGAAFETPIEGFRVALDLDKVKDQSVAVKFGSEYDIREMFRIRLGYNSAIDADNGLTAGFGISYGDFSIDYAYIPFGDIGRSHRVSAGYRFGKEKTEVSKKEDRSEGIPGQEEKTVRPDKVIRKKPEQEEKPKSPAPVVRKPLPPPVYGPISPIGTERMEWVEKLIPRLIEVEMKKVGREPGRGDQVRGRYYYHKNEVSLQFMLIDSEGRMVREVNGTEDRKKIILLVQELVRKLGE